MQVDAVIGCIPSGNQSKLRNMQACRPLFAFQFDCIRPELLSHHKTLRKLIRETRFGRTSPQTPVDLLLHDLNRTGRRDKARFREAIQKHARPEEMIAVPVSCIIHHHRVLQTVDERRRDRRPGQLVFTRRKIGCHDGILGVTNTLYFKRVFAVFWPR